MSLRDCTCLGACKGPEGLAPGWRCVIGPKCGHCGKRWPCGCPAGERILATLSEKAAAERPEGMTPTIILNQEESHRWLHDEDYRAEMRRQARELARSVNRTVHVRGTGLEKSRELLYRSDLDAMVTT